MKNIKPYPSYKPSGIAWLGEIPSHWEVRKLKFVDYVNMGQSPNSEDCNMDKIGLPFLQGNAEFGKFHPIPKLWCVNPNKIAQKDDILLSVRAPIGAINFAKEKTGIGRGLCAITACKTQIGYLYYSLLNQNKELNSIGTGSTFKAISVDDVRNINLIYPTISEQTAIAHFLDYKLHKIDRFIRKKKKLIGLLNEQKAAIINDAVTKGLDPTVLMKDSGIEWLGGVPKHWEIGKLKYLTSKIGDGIHATPEYDDNGTIPFINGNNLIKGKINITDRTRLVNSKEYEKYKIELKIGSLLISINGTIGNLAFYQGEDVVFGKSSAFIELKSDIEKEFLYYVLQSEYISRYFTSTFMGSTINNLSLHAIRNTTIFLPPLSEQKSIVIHIEKETALLNQTINTIEREIGLVQEYRTTLIAEAVTGKIDVRSYELGVMNDELEEELAVDMGENTEGGDDE
jgi:type I restriction enzyme, S subunit